MYQQELEEYTPVFLPGKSHGQKSLAGYSPQGHKESDTTEACTQAWELLTDSEWSLVVVQPPSYVQFFVIP